MFLGQDSYPRQEFELSKTNQCLCISMESIIGSNDLFPASFLEKGFKLQAAVGRIRTNDSNLATGFNVGQLSNKFFLLISTDHTYSPNLKEGNVEFNYQDDINGNPKGESIHKLRPDVFFYSNKELDYSMIAAEGNLHSNFIDLTDIGNIHTSKFINLIHHPNGERKQVSLINNSKVGYNANNFCYESDSLPGSSGAPALDGTTWQLLGIHKLGVSFYCPSSANQAVRIDRVIEDMTKTFATIENGTRVLQSLGLIEMEIIPVKEKQGFLI